MVEDNENDSEMFSEVYALLDQLSNNSKEVVDIEGKDMDKIESILVQRTNELSLAVQIAQALMVKHENDTDNITELKKTNSHLKDQQQEYKSLLNQTMESLERNSTKIDSLNEEKKNLTKKMTTLQVQCEVYEQKNFDLTEENKTLNQKFSELESNLNKFERDNKRLTSELNVAVNQLKETQASESSLTTELSNLKTRYENLEATYNEYYNSTQEELLEIYEKTDYKKRDMDNLYIDEKSDISKARSEGGASTNESQGQKIETLMQIIEQVSKENAKLKEDYVEVDELLSEARNEISTLQEQLLSEQMNNSATVNVSQEIEAYNQNNSNETKSIEIQTDTIPVKSVKKVDKGTQCSIINVISKKKKTIPISSRLYTPPASPTRSNSSSTIDTGNKNAPKRKVIKNKVMTGKDYYYLSPADTRFNSSYSIDGRPRWQLWKIK
jgi:DNA repair exonuclease SbcCD ATPase subunit